MMNSEKISREKTRTGFLIIAVNEGNDAAVAIPRKRGSKIITAMTPSIWPGDSENPAAMPVNPGTRDDQKPKFRGVNNTAEAVAIVVRVIERAAFPLLR